MIEVPLSLYVHIPWCIKKCPYCDFNSHQARSYVPENEYIDALILDLMRYEKLISAREVISIFIGGGTPSLFNADSIGRLLLAIRAQLTLSQDIEITIEANPGTIDQENFSGFRQAGVNRISIGVQSFNDAHLQKLGRVHSVQTAYDAIESAKQAGFDNFNIDLMYALPNQTLAQAAFDVEQAISLEPTHISYYQLTLEPNTYFYKHPPSLPSEELGWNMYAQGAQLLAQHNYQQYEVSAYSKPGFTCTHNKNYWLFGDYIGLGAGAHQKLSNVHSGAILRSEKPRHPQQYIRHTHAEKFDMPQALTLDDITFEYVLNALRLKKGFTRTQFEHYTGLPYERLQSNLNPLLEDKLIIADHQSIRCSEKGYRFLDDVLEQFLPQ